MLTTFNFQSTNRTQVALLVAALLLLITAGCSHNVYELEMKVSPTGLDRTLTCWRKSGKDIEAMPENDLKRIGELYHTTVEPPFDRKHKFQAVFSDTLPADVGGVGYYTRSESPFGTRSIYQERFRGDVDAVAALARRSTATDELTNLIIGWFEQELGSEPGFPQLREFLTTEFRNDLKNVGLQIWFSSLERDSKAPMRVIQYLVERGYGSPTEMLVLSRSINNPQGLNDIIPRFVAKKLGVERGAPLPPSLDIFRSEDRLQSSMDRFLRTTDEFKRRRAAWEKAKETTPDLEEPNPGDQLVEIVGRAFLGGPVLQPSDELSVKLETGVQPYATNGNWNAAAHQVTWADQIESADGPPAFCYALWSEPNRDAQRERFGRVLLEGEDLASYIDWYTSLSAERLKAWDNFISTLKPGLGLDARIASFRFADDPQPENPDQEVRSAADTARELLLKKLLPQ